MYIFSPEYMSYIFRLIRSPIHDMKIQLTLMLLNYEIKKTVVTDCEHII